MRIWPARSVGRTSGRGALEITVEST